MQTTDNAKKNKQNFKYLRDRDKEMVKGIFRFYEVPGGSIGFNFRQYKGDPIERYDFTDGQVYTIPRGVARHLVKNGNYPIHEHMQDESGKMSVRVGQKVQRFGFESMDFIDDLSDMQPDIVIVDKVNDDTAFKKGL